MSVKSIHTDSAPEAVGPYSQAAVFDRLVFCSGQICLDPQTGKLIEGGVKEQTIQVMNNLQAVLKAADSGLDHVIKATIYLQNMDDFSTVNQVYAEFFTPPYPARATIEVAKLPLGALVEVEVVAYKS